MKLSTAMIAMGLLLGIGGVLALASPFAASLAVTTLVGVFFLVSGVVQAWLLFRSREGDGGAWVVAVLAMVAGIWLLANPLVGTLSLTLMLGALFLAMGLIRLMMASRVGGRPLTWFMALIGAASVAIGLFIIFDVAEFASSLLGIFLGIQLLVEGGGLIVFGASARARGF